MALFSGEKLRKKLERKGVASHIIKKRVATRVMRLAKARAVGDAVTKAVVSGVPGAGTVSRVLGSIPVVSELPIVKPLALEAARVSFDVPLGRSIAADLLPVWREFKEGDYKGAAFSGLAFLIASGGALWLMNRLGVTFPDWLLPTLLDLLKSAPAA